MGTSTDAIICFGISLPEDIELPWDDEEYDGVEDWWLTAVHGYEPPFRMFDSRGNWLPGMEKDEEKHRRYYDHRRAFKADHLLPVEIVHHCSGTYPMYIVAAPDTVRVASRGYPKAFNPDDLYTVEADEASVVEFCDRFGIDRDGESPRWWLCSMWS